MSAVAAIGPIERSLLQVRSLHKNFGGVKAVSDISFDVPDGLDIFRHRPERGREIDAAQSYQRCLSARLRFIVLQWHGPIGHAGPSARAARYRADLPEDPSVQAAQRAGKRDRGISCSSPHPGMAIRDARRRFRGRSTTVPRTGRAACCISSGMSATPAMCLPDRCRMVSSGCSNLHARSQRNLSSC